MKERYLIFIAGRSASTDLPEQWFDLSRGQGLEALPAFDRVYAFADGTTQTTVAPGRALLIGTVRDRSTNRMVCASELASVPSPDMSRWLIENCWGNYVAVSASPTLPGIDILRDPSGFVPCYQAEIDDWLLVASDARLLRDLGKAVCINWSEILRSLAIPTLASRETCLAGVSEPLPGERATILPDTRRSEILWSPARFAKADHEMSFVEHAEALQRVVIDSVSACVSRHDNLVLSLSGGLDSSIIAASVPDAASRIHAMNVFHGRGRCNEEQHALAVAEHFSIPLAVVELSADDVDPSRSLASRYARPTARAFTQPVDAALARHASATGATAFLHGHGGDNVFALLHSANPAVDRLKSVGPKGFVSTVLDLSRITQCAPWHVGYRAVLKAWLGRPRFVPRQNVGMLTPGAIQGLPPPDHPWLAELQDRLPGQRELGLAILEGISAVHHLNIDTQLETIYPLLSQPVIEYCLGIPTWYSCSGGRNRAVARAAFRARLPTVTIDRQSKGSFDEFAISILHRHHGLIRDLLLDGKLVQNGLVDRAAISTALERPAAMNPDYGRILELAETEAWIAGWS